MPAAPQGGRDLAVRRRADARRLTRIGGALSDAHAAYAPDSTAHSAIVPVPHAVSLPCTSLHRLSRQSLLLTFPLGDSGIARGVSWIAYMAFHNRGKGGRKQYKWQSASRDFFGAFLSGGLTGGTPQPLDGANGDGVSAPLAAG